MKPLQLTLGQPHNAEEWDDFLIRVMELYTKQEDKPKKAFWKQIERASKGKLGNEVCEYPHLREIAGLLKK